MIDLTNEEKNFVKRAIVSTKSDLKGLELNPTKREDMITILKKFHDRGYIVPRRIDNGKDSDMYIGLNIKLGNPLKTRKQKITEELEKETDSIINILNNNHNKKIKVLEARLVRAKEEREVAITVLEKKIAEEIKQLDKQKQKLLERKNIAEKSREKLDRDKKYEKKHKHDKSDDGLAKCWECGEWFKEGAGMSAHTRARHPELKE